MSGVAGAKGGHPILFFLPRFAQNQDKTVQNGTRYAALETGQPAQMPFKLKPHGKTVIDWQSRNMGK
jgi:hypothetical protein